MIHVREAKFISNRVDEGTVFPGYDRAMRDRKAARQPSQDAPGDDITEQTAR